jgi:hypothetical protein
MALTIQDSNFLSEMIQLANDQLEIQNREQDIVARWNNNDLFNTLVSADIEAAYPGITKDEVVAGITAFNAVLTALGDDTSGQASNLFKLTL